MRTNETGVKPNSEIFFHTPSNMAKSMFFHILCAGHFYCSKKYFVTRDNYDSYLIMYIKSGECLINYKEKDTLAKEGDIVLLNCKSPHIYSAKTELETLWLHFDGNVSEQYFNYIFEQFGCVISLKESNNFTKFLTLIVDAFIKGTALLEPIVSCHIQRMLTELLLNSSQNISSSNSEKNPVLDAIAYIEKRFINKISLNDISSYVNISPYYFSRIFKRETGYAPYEYILMMRLNRAKLLLKTTTKSIKEIAFETGYNSEANFVTAFRLNTNFTPKRFRETMY